MDLRGWPWKKKSSHKVTKAEKTFVTPDSVGSTLSSVAHLGDQQENCTNKNYVQISMESYTLMSGLEDQVVNLENQVKVLEDKLSAAYSDLDNKDNLVKQHAKVAEEAVSGWEKADREVVSLRCQLESITLSKLSVDERVPQLDGALKECMKQIRTVKEESEQKIQDVIHMKSLQWEKFKLELESEIEKLDKRLREEAGENAALLRSLHESSIIIVKLKEEKSKAEVELELQKKNVQSYEKEIKLLKYEFDMISKEMDIRNEEKKMIMKSAEAENKRHTKDAKTIAKLESEGQRLRSLLRKKFPGVAALAQMKLELESTHSFMGGIHKGKTSTSLQELEVFEEEKKRLKEALASSYTELRALKNLYTKTVGRLKCLEAELHVLHQERSSEKPSLSINNRNSRISSNSPSITSMSDSWHEHPESCDESLASSSDHFDIRRVRSSVKFENQKSETISELMDDFLEVEKMACSSDNGSIQIVNKVKNYAEDKGSNDTLKAEDTKCFSPYRSCADAKIPSIESNPDSDYLSILNRLQNIISMINSADIKDSKFCKIFEDLERAVCELRGYLPTTSEKDECKQDLKDKNMMLEEHAQLLAELKAQLASSRKSYNLAEIQLKCMTESYESLQTHAEEIEAENKFLKEKINELKNDLEEEKQCCHDALVRHKETDEKMQRNKCLACASNTEENNDINTRKDAELAAAEKKLAECQETLHVLGRQLQAMYPQVGLNASLHSKRLQMNEFSVKPNYDGSNSNGSCNNSDEIDHAEAYSVSSNSDIQGVSDEFSSQNFDYTS